MSNGWISKEVKGAIAIFVYLIVALLIYQSTCAEQTGDVGAVCEAVLYSLYIGLVLILIGGGIALFRLIGDIFD